jgi:hypothetical protein
MMFPVLNDSPLNMNSAIDLTKFHSNRYSQFGEDGILEKAFEVLSIREGYFCEFGAWDGKYLSNTFRLYEQGWSGCYIEGLRDRFKQLEANITRPGVSCVNAFVASEGAYSLDAILQRVGAVEVDLMSIDIDSDDLAVWRAVKRYRPKVVVIEYNQTIPCDVLYENPPGENKGNSSLALFRLAREKNYDLIATTDTNLVFIDSDVNGGRFRSFSVFDHEMWRGNRYFFGYDGTLIRVILGRHEPPYPYPELFRVPWNGLAFPQPTPLSFRRFDAPRWRVRLGVCWSFFMTALTRPLALRRGIKNKDHLWL